MGKKFFISVELLHLIAGFSLVASGCIAYFTNGLETALSWSIFGAMYISMSDIGEVEMSEQKLSHFTHKNRRLFGYFGACFSIVLVLYYLIELLNY